MSELLTSGVADYSSTLGDVRYRIIDLLLSLFRADDLK